MGRRQEEEEAYEEAARIARESTLRRSTRVRKPVQRPAEYDHDYDWGEEENYEPSTGSRKRKREVFESPKKKPRLSQDQPQQKQYVVKDISRHRFWRGREQFYVSWKSFDPTWEDRENVEHCTAFKDYFDKEKEKGTPWAQDDFVPPSRIDSDYGESSDDEGEESEEESSDQPMEEPIESDYEGEDDDEEEEITDEVSQEDEDDDEDDDAADKAKRGSGLRHFAEAKKKKYRLRGRSSETAKAHRG
eukprot:TRINITY_DN1281_c0_g1_i1.p1 TRINITY_DN1281_c0_g1~~TRINITY_DN1281_c0_g1_i1.p1  ORF type:complete len:246 (+),score=92.58 TRINITY_DN1281_c0_g1_i1:56-793(+)